MAGLGTVEFKDAMKTLYLGPLNDNVFRSTVLLNRLDKNSEHVSGNFAYIPVITGRNNAVGARKEVAQSTGAGPKFPAHGRQSYSKLTFAMGQHYGRGSISGVTKRKSSGGSEGAFASAIDTEMKGLMESLPEELNRMVCGYGNGRVATLYGDQADATTVVVDSRDPMNARVGDRVHVNDITNGNSWHPAGGAEITDINFNYGTNQYLLTLDTTTGAAITATADAVYFGAVNSGSITAEDSSWGQEILGIGSLVDDGNIGADLQVAAEHGEIMVDINNSTSVANTLVGGVTRSSNPWIQSNVIKNPNAAGTKRPITEVIMKEAVLTLVAQNGSPTGEIEAYCGPATWGSLGLTQVGSRVYNEYKKSVEMGFEYIEVDGIKVFYDRDIEEGSIFFMAMKHMMLLTQNDYEFIDTDGNILRNIADRDAWEFAINRDVQLAYNNGRKHLKLTDLDTVISVTGKLH